MLILEWEISFNTNTYAIMYTKFSGAQMKKLIRVYINIYLKIIIVFHVKLLLLYFNDNF